MPSESCTEPTLTVGKLAERSGLAISALHFYERSGLIHSTRDSGNRRHYSRDVLRASQRVGIPLAAIKTALDALPKRRTPREADWFMLSTDWRTRLDDQIEQLTRLREDLTNCIGCGCLSFARCQLVNPGDAMRGEGAGARRLEPGTPRPEPFEGCPLNS